MGCFMLFRTCFYRKGSVLKNLFFSLLIFFFLQNQYREYEAKWESWRGQLLQRREQMRKKRENRLSESPGPVETGGFPKPKVG